MLDATLERKTTAELSDTDYADVVREHGSKIYNAVYCMLGNAADAEDVVQEAFLKAFRALPDFKGESNISTWIYRIAMNAASDHIRKNRRNARLREPFNGDELKIVGNEQGSYGNPEKFYFEKELSETIQKSLLKLPLKFRVVLILKEIEGHSYRDIGKILGVSIGTVESRLFRAREMMRKDMIKYSGKASDCNETM
jgi:RNA polymerase sigma-70 factor, ECF subfamily